MRNLGLYTVVELRQLGGRAAAPVVEEEEEEEEEEAPKEDGSVDGSLAAKSILRALSSNADKMASTSALNSRHCLIFSNGKCGLLEKRCMSQNLWYKA